MASAGRILIIPKGEWKSDVTYGMLDLVYHNGIAWLAKESVVGIEPSDTAEEWHKVVDVDEIVDKKLSDMTTDWTYPTLNTGFIPYDEKNTNRIRYRKIGKIVYIRGAVEPTAEIASDSVTTICTLPSGYRPKDLNVNGIMQGTGMNKWCLSITTGGAVNIQRYGLTDNIAIPTGSWLNIDISYPID